MIIGLTGGSGTGKSSACAFFAEKGFLIADMDAISRKVCRKGEKCLAEIAEKFGNDILDENGELKRRALGDIVFNDEEKLKILNAVTHKYILEETVKIINENIDGNVVLDAPLLFEAGLDAYCDKTVAVLSDRKVRIQRLVKRDNLTSEQIEARINSQPEDDFYIQRCDFTVYNNAAVEDLHKSLEKELVFLNEE